MIAASLEVGRYLLRRLRESGRAGGVGGTSGGDDPSTEDGGKDEGGIDEYGGVGSG